MSSRRPSSATAAGAVAIASIGAIPFVREYPIAVAALAYLAILATGRTRLNWLGKGLAGRFARRSVRVAVFFVPLPFAGYVSWSGGLVESVVAAACAIALLFPDRRDVLRELRPARLALRPYRSWDDPVRDFIAFGGAGVAQEYFYRGVVLMALVPHIGWFAIVPAAAMFVFEHVAQSGRIHFDRRDLINHAIISVVFGALTIHAGSVLPAVVGHTVYNLPNVIQIFVRVHTQRSDRRVSP
ncbi:lysostaphin resistance A-like protein [Lentzea sp. HUAS TT2]|uniref:CPBP family intramembrane glutamic endopeptidase n=1 Tax=Lentzea sp. HUAS TT2 TaxID=3447454 RepID=UPI003F6E9FEE